MNKTIANSLIVGSIILISVAHHREQFGVGARNKRTKTIRGVFKMTHTKPDTGDRFYVIRPVGKAKNIFIREDLASQVYWGQHLYNTRNWNVKEITLDIPEWLYRKLEEKGDL